MRITIAGYGVEGKSSYQYWNTPENDVVIVDERDIPADELPVDASVITGEGVYTRLDGFDLVVRTASLPPRAIKTDGTVWSATNEFFSKCPAPIIGVTGSKGKGTTCSLIAGMLRAAGKTVHVVGNIGVPALDVISSIDPDDIVVYELSSFQLWDAEFSPTVAVVLYIEPEHLDVHLDMDDYIAAKSRIAASQSTVDRIVYNPHNTWSTQIANVSPGQKIPYQSPRYVHVEGDMFYHGETPICQTDAVLLPGAHNLDNACAAISAVWSWVQDGAVIADGLRSFSGLPHRLKFVREYGDVMYYDDSIATTPGSAIAAVRAFDAPKILILGGISKGVRYDELAEVVGVSNTRAVVLIGAEANAIERSLREAGYSAIDNLGSDVAMTAIVAAARAQAQPGDVVILSPSCASFDMFNNYSDRGDQYIAAVQALGDDGEIS